MRGFEDIGLISGVVLLDCCHDPLLSGCRIVCRVNCDFEVSQRPGHSEDVTPGGAIAGEVSASAAGVADDEIWCIIYRVPLIIMGVAGEGGADVVGMIERLPWREVRIG